MSDSATSLNKDDLPDSASSQRARWLRYGVRVPLLLWHILIHLPLTLIVCLGMLRPLKGVLVALQYANKAEQGRLDS